MVSTEKDRDTDSDYHRNIYSRCDVRIAVVRPVFVHYTQAGTFDFALASVGPNSRAV